MGLFTCKACAAKDSEIAYLRAELARERQRADERQMQFLALQRPESVAALTPTTPARSWAQDEQGLSVMHEGKELPFSAHPDTGELGVVIDGEWVSRREFDLWAARIGNEAAGIRPGDRE